MRAPLTLLALSLLLAACDIAEEPFRSQLVVEAVLVAGEPHPVVRLTRTLPITEPVPENGAGVPGARVRIERLGPDDGVDQSVHYQEDAFAPGFYQPEESESAVEPLRRYRITIEVPEGAGLVPAGSRVTGETLVPDTFRVVQPPPDSVHYDILAPAMELHVTRSHYPARQAVYVFSIVALDPDNYDLTPTYAALVDPEDRHRVVESSSPLLNEESYVLNPDGTRTLHIPWFAIAFFGPNRFTASALDDALYDFVRSRDAQFGAATLSPGEIPDVLTNLTNAVGVFGSVARAEVEVYVRE